MQGGDTMVFPKEIQDIIGSRPYRADEIGKSRSQVFLFEDMVLKTEPVCENAAGERIMLSYLQGKLPVPKLLCSTEEDGLQYLLMSRLPGKMACHEKYLQNPKKLVPLLAEALHMIWAVDAADCPRKTDVRARLQMIRRDVEQGIVSMDDAEPETYGRGGFASPKDLFDYLERNIPQEQLVFSHGDLCLPNVFLKDGRVSGFVDLGNAGLADPYQDIALCLRSLRHNLEGKYAPPDAAYPHIDPDALFYELGTQKDAEKMRYFILLDELF